MASGATAMLGAMPVKGGVAASDADIAVRLLHRYHPGLLRYQTDGEWQRSVAGFRHRFGTATSLDKQFLALARLLGRVRCSHTHINPTNQSETMVAAHLGAARLLPFNFTWHGSRMIVTDDPHGLGLEAGQEISTVNRVPVRGLQRALLGYTRADGALDDKRRALLTVGEARQFETFDWLTAPMRLWGERVLIGLGGKMRVPEERIFDTITLERRRALAPPPLPRDAATAWWTMEKRGGIAVLRMPSWAVFNTDWEWQGWLDAQLDAMAGDGTRGLVIDLRGNEGGYFDCGRALIERIAGAPVPLPAEERLTRLGTVADEDRPYLTTWDDSLYTVGAAFPDAGGGMRRVPIEGERVIRPRGARFAGAVALLVGADNSSATGIFAQLVKENRLGLLVGQETGRNQRGGNGDAFFFARLPASDLSFDIPLVASHVVGFQPNAGTLPDVPVPLAATLRSDGVDVMLEAALRSLGVRG
ncbi:S41 family peptidase [Sphingomicrobium arenosum]|uniref:S41 family peptidase n=1 Tax=Sphingomicrobium arenosum TaxID=2233861 RepID=UPI002240EC2F|nr:S41 family peptidase [Sphingomicrobium arenosum]